MQAERICCSYVKKLLVMAMFVGRAEEVPDAAGEVAPVRRLTNDPGDNFADGYSRDGRFIALSSTRDSTFRCPGHLPNASRRHAGDESHPDPDCQGIRSELAALADARFIGSHG